MSADSMIGFLGGALSSNPHFVHHGLPGIFQVGDLFIRRSPSYEVIISVLSINPRKRNMKTV